MNPTYNNTIDPSSDENNEESKGENLSSSVLKKQLDDDSLPNGMSMTATATDSSFLKPINIERSFSWIMIEKSTEGEEEFQVLQGQMNLQISQKNIVEQIKRFDNQTLNINNHEKTLNKQFPKIKTLIDDGKLDHFKVDGGFNEEETIAIFGAIRYFTLPATSYNDRKTEESHTINELANRYILEEIKLIGTDDEARLKYVRDQLLNLALLTTCITKFVREISHPTKVEPYTCYKIVQKEEDLKNTFGQVIIAYESLEAAIKSFKLIRSFILLKLQIPAQFERAAKVGDISKRPQDKQVIILPFTRYNETEKSDKEAFSKLCLQQNFEEKFGNYVDQKFLKPSKIKIQVRDIELNP